MRVEVVAGHHLEQDVEGEGGSPGVQQRHPDVVEDLALRHPAGLVPAPAPALAAPSLRGLQPVQGVLEVVNCEVGLLHNLVETAEVVVVMWEHPIA